MSKQKINRSNSKNFRATTTTSTTTTKIITVTRLTIVITIVISSLGLKCKFLNRIKRFLFTLFIFQRENKVYLFSCEGFIS